MSIVKIHFFRLIRLGGKRLIIQDCKAITTIFWMGNFNGIVLEFVANLIFFKYYINFK